MGQREKTVYRKLDTLGIEPSTSRTMHSTTGMKLMLSERDNQLHHVPNIKSGEMIYSMNLSTQTVIKSPIP